ncbi:MAG: hypothetical protein ACRD5M_07565 [Candidatus Acidiferrales bacterium]
MRKVFLAGLLLGTNMAAFGQAERPKPVYDFSLSREDKIKLAESAAPAEISGKATVHVLDRTGYVKVREGTNGFTCFVDRQAPLNSEPTCFDAEGTATTLPTRFLAEEMRAQGKSEDEINAAIESGYKSGKFSAPRKPGIVYMMSDSVYIYIESKNVMAHVPPHLMFYDPYATSKDIGSPPAAANMPHVIRDGQPDAYIIVVPGHGAGH